MDKITFKNLPDTTTPLNATNLNKMQSNIEIQMNTKISKTASNITASDDFNNITETAIYSFGGVESANRPPNWGVVEVINANGFIIQRCSGSGTIATRFSSSDGESWGSWKSTTLS